MILTNTKYIKFFLFIIFCFLISCSSTDTENMVDLDYFRNQGKNIIYSNDKQDVNFELNKIKSLEYKENKFLSNFERNFEYKIQKSKIKILNESIKSNILYSKEGIFFIDNKNNLKIYDYNLKIIKSIFFLKDSISKNSNFFINKNDDFIFIATSDGRLFSINFKNNNIVWKLNLGAPIISNIEIYFNKIFFINSNSKIYSINTDNGKINWSYETVSENFKSKKSFKLIIKKNILIFSNDNADLIAIDLKTNSILWNINLQNFLLISETKLFEIVDISFKEDYLYVSTNQNNLLKINIFNGKVNWKKNISIQTKPIFYNNFIFFINMENFFICINLNNGQLFLSKNLNPLLTNKKFSKKKIFSNIIVISNSFFITFYNSNLAIKIDFSDLHKLKLIDIRYFINNNFFIHKNNIFFTDKSKLKKIEFNDN